MRTLIAIALLTAAGLPAQVLGPASLTGKYFARHVEYTTDANNNVTDAGSVIGTITFDGAGNYTFSGQQVISAGTPAAYTVTGTYTLSAAGVVSLVNPQKSSLTVNARFGTEAVIGTSTEASGNTFDLFVAIPAPAAGATTSNATLSTSWALVDFELTGASTSQVRDSGSSLQFDGAGNISLLSATGHAASVAGGTSQKQQFTGSYSLNADGSGTISFVPPSGLLPSNALLGAGTRTLGVSASGHMLIAGSPGGHDMLVGVRTAATDNITASSFAGRYWLAGLESDASGNSLDYSGALNVIAADSAAVISERRHQISSPGHVFETGSSGYTVATASSGGVLLSVGAVLISPGAGNTFVGADTGSLADQGTFSIIMGDQIPAVSGTGVFVNPQGVVNAASNAPVGNPVSPGEFISLYGTGLAPQTVVAAPPYPTSLGGVSVMIGGYPAPLYLVSAGQINCLVPFEISTATASTTVQVNDNGVLSNTITPPVSATSPGIFSDDLTGTGDGAVTHLSGVLVNSKNPATIGETLTIYLTGLGTLQNPIKDGSAPTPPAADSASATIQVYVDGVPSPNVLYSGINPVYPGLYQINFQVPSVPDHGEVSLAIVTPDAIHAQITLYMQ